MYLNSCYSPELRSIQSPGTLNWQVLNYYCGTSLVAQMVKRLPTVRETWVWFLGQEDPLKKEMATHSSSLAWKIPWTEEPGRLQSMGSQRVRHDLTTSSKLLLKKGRVRCLWASGHNIFTNQSIYNLVFCVFLFKDTLFNELLIH